MNQNILITSAGQRVSLVQFFQQELKKINPNSKVFTVDANPSLAPACIVSDGFRKLPKVDCENYIPSLLQFCQEEEIKIIIPTIDTELLILSEYKEFFKSNGIEVVVSDTEFVKICRDKWKSNYFFEKHGVQIPKQFDLQNLQYPLFIKPFDGSLSKDIYILHSESDLQDKHITNHKLMYMEYIDPSLFDEYTVDTYYDKEGFLKCVVPRKRIFVRAGEVNKAVTRKNVICSIVGDKFKRIEGARGCITMQFFLSNSDDRLVGIEINPRFGGGFPLSYLSGANYPKFILQEYLFNEKIEFFENWKDDLLMLRYDKEVLVEDYGR